MKIEVNLFSSLARLKPKDLGTDPWILECREGITVEELLRELKLPEKSCKLTFINKNHAGRATVLKDGDRVGIYPPVGGG